MSRLAFELRFAIRNILGNVGRSLVVFFTMTIVVALAVAGFTIDDSFRQIFTYEQTERYLDVDLVMTYDANSTTRIMNKRTIAQNHADLFRFYASFFNFYAVIETGSETVYANVMASSVAEMERVIKTDLPSLSAGEAVIPKTFADALGLKAGETFALYVGGIARSFTVVMVADDVGLLSGDTIFLEKTALLDLVYGASNLGNLGNTIYFDLAPGVTVADATAALTAEPEYASFLFTEIVDRVAIARMATFNSSIFFGIGLMAIVALVLVLRSVFPILFRDVSAQLGVIRTLGGSDRFAFRVWLWEFAIILAAAVPLGLLLTAIAFNIAGPIVGVEGAILLDPLLASAAVGAVVLILFAELAVRFVRLKARAAVSLSVDHRTEAAPAPFVVFGVAVLLFAINRLAGTWSSSWGRLAETAFVLAAAFSGSGLLLRLIAALARRRRDPSVFGLFTIRHLSSDRVAHNAIKVAAMAVVTIAVTLMLNNFIAVATDEFDGQVKADYILTNIFDYEASLRDEIVAGYAPASVAEASLYTKVLLSTAAGEKRLRYVFSLDFAELPDYFDFTFDPSVGDKFADTTRTYILLPFSLGRIYDLQEGDEVTLEIGSDLPEATFTVAGFIDTYFDSIAITNLVNVAAYADVAPVNALLMNAPDDGATATAIVKAYSSRMYYLIDVDETIAKNVKLFLAVANYLTIIGWAVVFCFMIVILNNAVLVFDVMKADYARLMTIGVGTRGLYRLFAAEAAIMTAATVTVASVILVLFFPAMPELMLLFDNYKIIPFDPAVAAFSVGAGILVFLLGYGSYFVKVKRLRIVDEIKRY